jgi:hypothetical protein
MLLCLIMVIETFKVEHVFIEVILGHFYFLLLTYNFVVVLLLHFFIFVAFVEIHSMLVPLSQTEPTELMRT